MLQASSLECLTQNGNPLYFSMIKPQPLKCLKTNNEGELINEVSGADCEIRKNSIVKSLNARGLCLIAKYVRLHKRQRTVSDVRTHY